MEEEDEGMGEEDEEEDSDSGAEEVELQNLVGGPVVDKDTLEDLNQEQEEVLEELQGLLEDQEISLGELCTLYRSVVGGTML